MKVHYALAVYGQVEIDAVVNILENSSLNLTDGKEVALFEGRVADLFGKRYGLMVNSGSSANTLAIASLELPRGSEVITPALTFSTTVAPLVQQALLPVFVDVGLDTFTIDADRVEDMVGPQTRAMMIPNLIGNLPDWQRLRDIADRHGLAVVEDSADTIGSLYRGKPTGSLSDIATTSFYASHVITSAGSGGMVMFHDRQLEQRARLLRGWGRGSSILSDSESIDVRVDAEVDGISYDAKFLFSAIGYNFMPSEVAAAFGNVQLDRLERFTEVRRANFAAMRDFFAEYEEWFILPRQNADIETAWLAVPLIVRDDAPFTRRDLQLHLEHAEIQTRVVFTGNILRQPAFREIERREDPAGYPNADRVTRGGILLGCHQGMTRKHLDYVMSVFRNFASTR